MEITYKVKLKKLKLDVDTQRKYNQDYNLDNMIRNTEKWKYGDPMILDDENLLFSLLYFYVGDIAERKDGKDWYGNNNFIFHIVEKNDKIFIKYVNLYRIEDIVEKYAIMKINNLGQYQVKQQGLIQKEYREYIRNEAMKIIEIDKNEFEKRINRLKKIRYDELEFFTCKTAYESIDYFDYINRINFYCDRYYPEKYEECIKFVNYILSECKILNMEEVIMKSFKEEERKNIMIDLIKEKIELEGGYIT